MVQLRAFFSADMSLYVTPIRNFDKNTDLLITMSQIFGDFLTLTSFFWGAGIKADLQLTKGLRLNRFVSRICQINSKKNLKITADDPLGAILVS